jgi:ribosomal protein L11 methyltransferase
VTWSVSFLVPQLKAEEFADAFTDVALSVSHFEDTGDDPTQWRVEALFEAEPDRTELTVRIASIAALPGENNPSIDIVQLAETDWVAATLSSFVPMHIGRFWVHGSHDKDTAPSGSVPLTVDAATAFGTGEHATTHGCLLALDGLAKRDNFRRTVAQSGRTPIIDVGCGTGILAMAAARCWPANVLASDIDAEAVRVARGMVGANGLAARITVMQADAITERHLMAEAPYAVITANILARPLCRMAGGLSAALAPQGRIVLSGLLNSQVSMVRSAYQSCGLSLEKVIPIAEWATLVVKR